MTNHFYSKHPYYMYFRDMVYRGEIVGSNFSLGLPEFNRWLEVVGQIPEDMDWPTIGRYDHTIGYIFDERNNRWNFRWEEKRENSRENGFRNGHKGGRTVGLMLGRERRSGLHLMTSEQKREYGRLGLTRSIELKKTGMQSRTTCPHCGLTGQTVNLKRYHFDNCKRREYNEINS